MKGDINRKEEEDKNEGRKFRDMRRKSSCYSTDEEILAATTRY
jgi:hypothetical protein